MPIVVDLPFAQEAGLAARARQRIETAIADFRRVWNSWRRPARQPLRLVEAFLALAACFAIIVVAALADIDVWRLASEAPEPVVRVFARITALGTSGYIFFLSAIVWLYAILARGTQWPARVNAGLEILAARAFFIFAINAASGVASQLIKHLFGRARPKFMDIVGPFHFDTFSLSASQASFPSGHSVTAFATAWAMGLFAPRLRWPLLVVAALVGLSRIVIGAHFASDVFAGILLGLGTTLLMGRSFGRRRVALQIRKGRLVARGQGLVLPALRATLGGRPRE